MIKVGENMAAPESLPGKRKPVTCIRRPRRTSYTGVGMLPGYRSSRVCSKPNAGQIHLGISVRVFLKGSTGVGKGDFWSFYHIQLPTGFVDTANTCRMAHMDVSSMDPGLNLKSLTSVSVIPAP
ncbi:hypothetical protein LEMLEM_LOCUS10703 [Lemmus lemmus]